MQEPTNTSQRIPLIRQAVVFQLKLGLDALRDILMSPISIVLVILDIVFGNNAQQSYFLRLMRLGKKSDHWINLFEANLPNEESDQTDSKAENNADYWFSHIEKVIKEQQVDGKLTQSGKEKLQKYFGHMNQSENNTTEKNEY